MNIQDQDLFHGAALTQIVEHVEGSVTIEKIKDTFGLYTINNKINVLLKYRSNGRAPWRFNFTSNEVEILERYVYGKKIFFLVLICGSRSICALSRREILDLIKPSSGEEQSICVNSGYRKSLWVNGSVGDLSGTVRHNDFPAKLFKDEEQIQYEEIS